MLWNDKFLFLHVPKTAGTSLTDALFAAWERPISGFVSRGSYLKEMKRDPDGLSLTIGSAHWSLSRAQAMFAGRKIRLSDFEAIIVAIRNPYALMVSTYHFMRQSYATEKDNPKYRFAAERDFATFCRRIPMMDVDQWLTIDGVRPGNIVILRMEHLADDFDDISARYHFRPAHLPRLNVSSHKAFEEYMTPSIKDEIYRRLPYLFDEGFYAR